ncbi:uncharacterized protein TrAFT101_010024 [Trichoderma asperellum]|uniref:Uncharacterized protein n=2 Tax=Trichoderma asperellum TaxID=101201 RepID=A0A2T3Z975_TRIA4|nr:hypothetical protein M441DRAFT_26585 [Trichoderma asperellum CBS 433.97]PTB41363.1 hypothetical protein M441DRAFT_26585 [Trichoderma asperellum CBS 433.97]UKZ95173.1 hypothetical protein TrAFT101_010024 [Trichoderma asperellum]
MGSSTATPGQGYEQTQTPPLSPSLSLALDSPSTPRATPSARPNPRLVVDRRDALFNVGPASPPKQQSPLRQSTSISYQDCAGRPDLSQFVKPRHNPKLQRGHSRSRSDFSSNTTSSNIPLRAGQAPGAQSASPSTDSSHSENQSPTFATRRTSFGEVGQDRRVTNHSDCNRSNTASPSSPRNSTLSFIASKMPAIKALAPAPVVVPQNDELIGLNIETSLFPKGNPPDGQTFSPAAFMNLQQTATGLLKKYQTAYKRQATTIQEMIAEKEAIDDEKAEADTRTRHLKMQLEGMAQKLAETESEMQTLMEELNKEKRLRMEERAAARDKFLTPSEGSISEDLCVEEDQQRRRGWRRSGETSKTDFSFETDEDSVEAASIFSRPRSPTNTALSIISDVEGPAPPGPPSRTSTFGANRPVRNSQPPQLTTFQKLFKIDPDRDIKGCRNCQGQDASIAWDTVGLLKAENKTLKERVSELEEAVEEVLDVVNGVGQ